MSDEILNRIEKHMEGTQLGLAALSEVLQKMDARIENEAEASYELAKAEEEALEKEALVRDIAKAVLIELSDQGMDVDGTDIENVGKPDPTKGATATPNYIGDADDSSETVTPRTDISEQQASIMAEKKEDEEEEKAYTKMGMNKAEGEEDKDKEEGDEEEKAMGFPKKEKAMHEGGDEDKEDDEGDDDDDVKKLFKQMSSLQKQIESLDISKSVKEESENRLRKMGFKEENGLQKPQLNNVFGADETPIKKAQTVNDVVDQLTNLSYKELRKMQEFKRQGLTENLPDEIANL
jgi:ParB-like chromosome segregation protein Spo0J